MSRTRSLFALVLPLLVLWAWIGCIVVCVDETAGCEKTAGTEIASVGNHAAIEPLCVETCAPANPAAVQERQGLGAPALAILKEAITAPVLAVAHTRRTEPGAIRAHAPPRITEPLFIRFNNFRI